MKKKNIRLNPFRIASVVLGVIALAMLVRFPGEMLTLERQYDEYEKAKEARDDAKSRQIQLTQELAEVDDKDFIERTARREFGYCWYGETIYRVGNLDEIQAIDGMQVYDGEQAEEETTEQ